MEELFGELFEHPEPAGGDGAEHPCGLDEARRLEDGQAGRGMVVTVDGQSYDLGPSIFMEPAVDWVDISQPGESSVTLADDRGLSIYSDTDGDGTVDQVTTVLFDGSWQTWDSEAGIKGGGNHGGDGGSQDIGDWGAYEWEEVVRARRG